MELQGKKETLSEYIDRFTKLDVVLEDGEDDLKSWIFNKVLREDYMFHENLGLEWANNMNELLN